jgi:hypothetical protein
MSHSGNLANRALPSFAGLPPGVSQRDCDGPADALGDMDAPGLWAASSPSLREKIAMGFARARRDDVRDALLEAAQSGRDSAPLAPKKLGAVLWRAWIDYRDQMLNQLRRRGQLDLQ